MLREVLVLGFLFLAALVPGPSASEDSTAPRTISQELPEELRWILFAESDPAVMVVRNDNEDIFYTIKSIPRGARVSESWHQGCGDRERFLIPGSDSSSCTTRYGAFVIYRFDGARQQVPDQPSDTPLEYRRMKASEPMFVALDTNERSPTAEIWVKEGLEEELFWVTEVYGRFKEELKKKPEQHEKDEGRTDNARCNTPGVLISSHVVEH